MKALVLKQYRHFEIEEMPVPQIGVDDVLVHVKACGICGSDIHGMDGSSGRRIPPIVMGHEASGVIAELGSNVASFSIGDRVTFDSTVSCGECFFCRRGVSCSEYRQHGAFAEYIAVPQHILYRLPGSLTFEQASMIEPVSVAFHAVDLTPVSLNDTAAVVGAGIIGLLVIQALRLAGCGRIIAVDIEPNRLELASKLGAEECLNPKETDVPGEIAKRTGGRGADIAVDAVGNNASVKTTFASVRKGGVVTLVGNIEPAVELPLQLVVIREIKVLGSCASYGEYPACLDMIARGDIRVDPLISAVAPLSEGRAWFERLYQGEAGLMKVVLNP
jgi:L-iditol 2-dehydrogenase